MLYETNMQQHLTLTSVDLKKGLSAAYEDVCRKRLFSHENNSIWQTRKDWFNCHQDLVHSIENKTFQFSQNVSTWGPSLGETRVAWAEIMEIVNVPTGRHHKNVSTLTLFA